MIKLFDMFITQEDDIDMGKTCRGDTLLSPGDKGYFSGAELSGEVIPAGMGVTYTPAPGVNDIESTMLLKTDDGAYVIMEMKAFLNIGEAVEAKLMKGEYADPGEYYFKGTVIFRTGDDRYKWMERKVCICETEIINWEDLKIIVYMV